MLLIFKILFIFFLKTISYLLKNKTLCLFQILSIWANMCLHPSVGRQLAKRQEVVSNLLAIIGKIMSYYVNNSLFQYNRVLIFENTFKTDFLKSKGQWTQWFSIFFFVNSSKGNF